MTLFLEQGRKEGRGRGEEVLFLTVAASSSASSSASAFASASGGVWPIQRKRGEDFPHVYCTGEERSKG